MSTVIFDFDSTIINRESLEEILSAKFKGNPQLEKKIRAITDLGMEGDISFRESLARRLSLASPTRADVQAFGESAHELLTPGMDTLIDSLLQRGHEVHIVSGGLFEGITPLAARMGIPASRVHSVKLLWSEQGDFAGIDPNDIFSVSKIEGARPWLPSLSAPRIAVGDGMTDYYLFRDGLVNAFVAFTANVRRAAVVATGQPEARNTSELAEILEDLL